MKPKRPKYKKPRKPTDGHTYTRPYTKGRLPEDCERPKPKGRPKRGDKPGTPRCAKLEDHVYIGLSNEFGSIGNALYYLFDACQSYRKSNGLPPLNTKEKLWGVKRQKGSLTG